MAEDPSLALRGHLWAAYLSEVDGFVFGDAVGILAGKHAAVAAIHLLRDFLMKQKQTQIATQRQQQTFHVSLHDFPQIQRVLREPKMPLRFWGFQVL